MVARNMRQVLLEQRRALEANYGLTGAPQHKLDLLWDYCWNQGENCGTGAASSRQITEAVYGQLAPLVV